MSQQPIKNNISYKELIKNIVLVSLSAYGGPALMGVIKKKFVDEKKWIEESDFLESLSISQALPGAVSVNLIAILGLKMKGFFGTFIFTFFFLLQAFCFIIINAHLYTVYQDTIIITAIFTGLRAVVVALFLYATVLLAKPIFGKPSIKNIKIYLITLIVFYLSYFIKIDIRILLLLSAALGFLFYYFTNEVKEGNKTSFNNTEKKNNIFKNPALYFCLIYISTLVIIYYFSSSLWILFYNFFQIGLFGFGGGYIVIPIIQDIVVNKLALVSLIEFKNGIAMSQLTPGPVFITTTYIGFISKGLIGAITSTIATYSPSIFIVLLLNKSILKISHTKTFKVIIKGILAGFIGTLIGSVIEFGIVSLINWQTWLIFAVAIIILFVLKKESIWAVISTIILSIILFL